MRQAFACEYIIRYKILHSSQGVISPVEPSAPIIFVHNDTQETGIGGIKVH